jgi:hypothetical protein
MDDARNTKKTYQANLHQKRPKGMPKARRKCYVQNYIRKMGEVEQEGGGWKRATRTVLTLFGLWSQGRRWWRRRKRRRKRRLLGYFTARVSYVVFQRPF